VPELALQRGSVEAFFVVPHGKIPWAVGVSNVVVMKGAPKQLLHREKYAKDPIKNFYRQWGCVFQDGFRCQRRVSRVFSRDDEQDVPIYRPLRHSHSFTPRNEKIARDCLSKVRSSKTITNRLFVRFANIAHFQLMCPKGVLVDTKVLHNSLPI